MKTIALPAWPTVRQGVTARYVLLLSAGILLCLGLVMVASASMDVADAQFGNPFHFFVRHLIYLLIGLAAGLFVMRIPVSFWQRVSAPLLITALLLLILVLIPGIGHRINGSMRWLGVGPLTVQPSEIAKFAVIVYMSAYLLRRQDEVRSSWFGFIKPMVVMGLAVAPLLMEPDFGASGVMMMAVLGMLFLAGTPAPKFVALMAAVLGLGILAVYTESYRMKRLLAFTDPWADQFNSGYQLTQSLIAFGRGEWFGVGLGKSVQKLFYLPEAHTDFVFAVYAEEFGLVGVVLVIFLFWLLIRSGMRIGQRAEQRGDAYAAYLAYGLSFLMGVQVLVNIGVNMGLFPTKGLTLPLMSYGGSSLVIVFVMLGVLLRIDGENNAASARSTAKYPGPSRPQYPASSLSQYPASSRQGDQE
jgi:cell division protein FtsW